MSILSNQHSNENFLILTDDQLFAKALALYVSNFVVPEENVFFMTYDHRHGQEAYKNADFIILQLFKKSGFRLRAEGIMTAENLVRHNRKFLIISVYSRGDHIYSDIYWDLASKDQLCDRVLFLLNNQVDAKVQLAYLKNKYEKNCFSISCH